MMHDGEMSVQELQRRLQNNDDLFLLDVRQPEEYAIVHMDAVLIPLSELPARLSELNPEREIVVYCHHGTRSRHAMQFLRRSGFVHVKNLTGGIDAWAVLVDPSMKRY
jgi:rhodanese-related sulfurtransferase